MPGENPRSGLFFISNSYSKIPRSKLLFSAQVFCVSFLPMPFQLLFRWFTLKWHHVNITSPNCAVVKANFKATSGTRGFAQSCGASAQLMFLQDSSKVHPSPLHTTTACWGWLPSAWVSIFCPQRCVDRLLCWDLLPPWRLSEFHIILGFQQQEKPVTAITNDKPQGPRGPTVIRFSGHVIKVARIILPW